MNEMTEQAYKQAKADARKAGEDAGRAAASWYFDGNTDEQTYRRVLKGLDDGDPEVLDGLPYLDLSGQWADGPTMASVLEDIGCDVDGDDDAAEDIVNKYQSAYDAAVVAEVERMAREHLSA